MRARQILCVMTGLMWTLAGCTTSPSPSGPSGTHVMGSDAGLPGIDSGATPASTPLPCDVQAATTVCRNCHGASPAFGAPMSIVAWDDTQKPAVTDSSKTVYQMMSERIHSTTLPMPPAPYTLSAADAATIDAWVQAGAPAGTSGQTCGNTGADGGTDGGGVLNGVGPDYLPCTPSYTFTAHDPTDPSQGFTVPTGGSHNYYECFVFKAPFAPGEQGTAFAPIIDKKAELHHWILWESTGTTFTDGTTFKDGDVHICGAIPDGTSKFIAGWAPGGQNFVMPSDVGLHFDQGSTLLLQVHYYNPSDVTGVRDKSGVALCTDTGRPKEAGIMATGPTYPTPTSPFLCNDLPDNMALCVPPHTVKDIYADCPWSTITDPLYSWANNIPAGGFDILASYPHMHLIGTKFETDIIHPDGSTDVLVKVDPFDFNEQTAYPHDPPVHVNPGDKIRTSCTYDNQSNSTVYLGEKTTDEMCFNFMMITPFPTYNGGMMVCPVPGLPATLL